LDTLIAQDSSIVNQYIEPLPSDDLLGFFEGILDAGLIGDF
jgi:hypothetical protein